MPVAQTNRDRLRGGLLGPLGEETTDMLMDALDQRGLRDHVDERFDEQRRYVDQRFEQVDKRFEQVDKRFEQIEDRLARIDDAVRMLALAVASSSRPANTIVYTVCGTIAVVAIATFLESVLAG
ncbi:MAG TPA: hypothetical protein VNU01_09720 [Egibacteraceae bacterium]|nr:hypothetical protein [Egibacteraceae bacterium]